MLDRAAALDCDWVLTSDGKTPIYADTLTAAVRDIANDMKASKETPEPFKLSDIRRTAETMMAAMGISGTCAPRFSCTDSEALSNATMTGMITGPKRDARSERRLAGCAMA